MKGRIKPGTLIGQDFVFLRWPEDQNIIFDIEDVGSNFKRCTAPGFGKRGDYGNGSVYVFDPDGIEPILEPDDMTLELLNLIQELVDIVKNYHEGECCDHEAGICYCGEYAVLDDAERLLKKYK